MRYFQDNFNELVTKSNRMKHHSFFEEKKIFQIMKKLAVSNICKNKH